MQATLTGLAEVAVNAVVGHEMPAGVEVKLTVLSNMGGVRATLMVMVEPGVPVVGLAVMLAIAGTC